jgi:hypothetical protein
MDTITEKEATDFKTKLFNTLLNPFAGNDKTLSTTGASPMSKALTHGAGLAVGYGGLAMLISKLKAKLDKPDMDREGEESIDSYVKARNLEMPFGKAATSGRHPMHAALAVAAAAAGLYGGTRLASKSDAAIKTHDLDAEIGDTERQIADLIKQEYNRTRGIEDQQKVAFMDTLKGGYGIYAAAALALAYAKAHDYVANSGEDAQKLKALQELAKRKKMLTEEPITINPINFGQSNNTLPSGAGEAKDMSSVALKGQGTGTPTDPNDPYASVLG